MHYWQQEWFSWVLVFHQLQAIHENKPAATHLPPPGPCWKGKAGIQNYITSSSPAPCTPHFCPPLATSLLSSVRAGIAAGTARIKHPLLTEEEEQGTDSNLKDIMSGGKKDFAQIQFTGQGPEGLKKITLLPECCCLLSGYTGRWISPRTKAFPFTLWQCRLKGPQETARHEPRQPITHSDFPNSLACLTWDVSQPPLLNTGWQLSGAQMLRVKQTRPITQEVPQVQRLEVHAKHDAQIQCIS